MQTYSRRPFVSFDKIDEKGVRAEVRVSLGYAVVEKIEPSGKGKSAKISFKAENNPHLVGGWAPVDDPVMEIVNDAFESKEPIHFRIEQRRKNDVDRTKTMDELAPAGDMKLSHANTFRALVAVKRENDENWVMSPHIYTRFEEDPVDTNHTSAYDVDLESFTGGKTNNVSTQNNFSTKGFESAPYVSRNPSGDVNAGSIAVSVPLNMYSFVLDFEREHNIEGLTDGQRATLAKVMLIAANELQIGVYSDTENPLEKPDLSLGSHTRARAIVFEVIRTFYPLTTNVAENKESLLEWKNNIVTKGLAMWKWSINEALPFIS